MDTPQSSVLALAAALMPTTVLKRLAQVAGPRTDLSELPAVRLCLSSGQVLYGGLVCVGTEQGHEVAVLAGGQAANELVYVPVPNVVAVTVCDPVPFQDVLTEGRLGAPVGGPPVTRLTLRRDFASTDEFPLVVDWGALPDSPAVMPNLGLLLRELKAAVREVVADEIGRQAWAEIRSLRVEHRPGVALSVHRDADEVSVGADLAAGLPREPGSELQRQLNALL